MKSKRQIDYRDSLYEFDGSEAGLGSLENMISTFFDPLMNEIDKLKYVKEEINIIDSRDLVNACDMLAEIDVMTATMLNLPDSLRDAICKDLHGIMENCGNQEDLMLDENGEVRLTLNMSVEALLPAGEDDSYYCLGEFEIRIWWEYRKEAYLVFQKQGGWLQDMKGIHSWNGVRGRKADHQKLVKEIVNVIIPERLQA